jgi:hypothetical protein
MTNSPCFDTTTRTDCPRRCVGCKIDCPDWEEWLAIHEEEKAKIREMKAIEEAADGFLIGQKERTRKDVLRRSERKNRRRKA